jgi:hypothetical protein
MSFSEKFMKLPQKVRLVIVGAVLAVLAVTGIAVLILLKNVLPEGKPSASSTTTAKAAASDSPAKTTAKPSATTPKKK